MLLKDEKNFDGIKRVYILLGPACNMVCRHCSQMPIKDLCMVQKDVSSSVWSFLDNYVSYAIEHPGKCLIIFWGGEPLLHLKVIKEIVVHFTEKYDLLSLPKKTGILFGLTTNGLLLNDEAVNFFNKYRVKVSLSYDAPYPFVVRGKVSNNICDIAKKIKYLSTISTFNAINYDYYLAIRCLQKKFPNVLHRMNFGLTQTFEMPDDIFNFDLDKICNSVRKLRIAAMLGDVESLNAFKFLLMPLQYPKQNEQFRKYLVKTCCTGFSSYSVTLDGKIISCHNSDECVGNVKDDTDNVNIASRKALLSRKSSECENCEHLDICTGRCTISLQENGKFTICDLFWKPFYSVLKKESLKFIEKLSDDDISWFSTEYEKDTVIVDAF